MSFYGMQVPKGDPDRIDKVVGNLKTIASDLHSNGHAVHTESGGMQKAWNSPAGRAAAAEAGTLSHEAISHAGTI
ncbi:MAG TPA: hypothetical protein VHC49_02735, partial [Mycobacteriales bacterium]|nr:hypothetical protein [Mycobacteriales bacterium]